MTQETVQQYCEHLGNIVNCKIFVKDDRPLGIFQESLEGLLGEGERSEETMERKLIGGSEWRNLHVFLSKSQNS